jgi:hypothetical protein
MWIRSRPADCLVIPENFDGRLAVSRPCQGPRKLVHQVPALHAHLSRPDMHFEGAKLQAWLRLAELAPLWEY